jgi:hypothetical protein
MAEDARLAPNPSATPATPGEGPGAAGDAAPAAADEQGPLGAVGHFIDKSVSGIATGLKATGQAIGDATAPARDAASAVVRLPKTGFVSGNERCAVAPNGAPDCATAAQALCRAKGFEGGRSLDTQTRTCLPQATAAGGSFKLGDCVYVTRALCQ